MWFSLSRRDLSGGVGIYLMAVASAAGVVTGTRSDPSGRVSASVRLLPKGPLWGKRQILDYFCLGVPVYRLRFHGIASRPVLDRFYRCCRVVMALDQECMEPFDGDLELDEIRQLADWWPSERQAWLGSQWQSNRVWHSETEWSSKGLPDTSTKP